MAMALACHRLGAYAQLKRQAASAFLRGSVPSLCGEKSRGCMPAELAVESTSKVQSRRTISWTRARKRRNLRITDSPGVCPGQLGGRQLADHAMCQRAVVGRSATTMSSRGMPVATGACADKGAGQLSPPGPLEAGGEARSLPGGAARADPLATATHKPVLVTRGHALPSTWDAPGGYAFLIDKPKGWTSFDVCGKLRRLLNIKKVGHAGTLDPMATGLLIVCVGRATKVVDGFQAMRKAYSGTIRLGEMTPSYDAESEVSGTKEWEHVSDDVIAQATELSVGDIWQRPPMFSAIQVKGERLYEKARRGETVDVPPRLVTVFNFSCTRNPLLRRDLDFYVECSKGTYVRSLAHDLGMELGTYGHLTALRRESIGSYKVQDAWQISDLAKAISIFRK